MTVTAVETMTEAPARPRGWTWLDVALLALVLAIAACVRVYFVDPDLTYDELWHMALSAGRGTPMGYYTRDVLQAQPLHLTSIVGAPAWWHIWTGMDGVLHPPLYVLTLRWWRELFGDSDRVAMAYSIAWSLVALVFTFASVRLATDRWLAFTTTLAMGLAQSQSYFASEVRGYAMLTGLAAVSLWVMTRIEVLGPTRGRAIGAALLTLTLLLTHYFAFGAAIAIAVHGFLRLREHRRAFAMWLVGAAVGYAVIWLPWAVRQIKFIGTADAFIQHPRDLTYELGLLASGPLRLVVDRIYYEHPQWLAGGLLYVVPFLLLRRAKWLLPWVLWLTLSIGALFVLDQIRSTFLLYMARYMAVASPAVFMLAAGSAYTIHRGLAHALVLTLAFMGAAYVTSTNFIVGECATFAQVERDLDKNVRAGDGLIFYHGSLYTFTSDALLLQASHSPTLFPRPMTIINGAMKPELVAQLPRRVWLVTGKLETPADEIVPGATVLKRINPDINLTLYYLELPELSAATTRPSGP